MLCNFQRRNTKKPEPEADANDPGVKEHVWRKRARSSKGRKQEWRTWIYDIKRFILISLHIFASLQRKGQRQQAGYMTQTTPAQKNTTKTRPLTAFVCVGVVVFVKRLPLHRGRLRHGARSFPILQHKRKIQLYFLSTYAFFTFTFASLLSFLCFLYFHSCFPCLLGRARFRQTCSFALGPFALASKCNVYALFACKLCLSKLTIKAIWFIS